MVLLRFARCVVSLSGVRRRLLAEAAMALAVTRLALGTLPFRVVMRTYGLTVKADKPVTSSRDFEALMVGWAVARTAKHMPFRAVCLQQALAASLMLQRRGLAVEVHVGVTKAMDGALLAHAWCCSAGAAVVGTRVADQHTPIAVFVA